MSHETSPTAAIDISNYPTQRHAGKVGYGPNYNTHASVIDKMHGLAEEIAGKLTHNENLAQKGHDMITGETRRKELLGEADSRDLVVDNEPNARKSPQATS